MWGLHAIWSPILHYDQETFKLHLFYSESRKEASPGGDIKLIISTDYGLTWSTPRVLLTHEEDGGVPKVLANKLCETSTGAWILPFWREPTDSWSEYPHYHPLQHSPKPHRRPPPPGSLPESRECSAGVLVSSDRGLTWTPRGRVRNPTTWLIENTVASLHDATQPSPSLLMLFRTGAGHVYSCTSQDDGHTWTAAAPTELPNPNSKIGMTKCNFPECSYNKGCLVVAYNHSAKQRAPLYLAASYDNGGTWKHAAVLEAEPTGNFAYPTPIQWEAGVVKVAYSVWGEGLRIATVRVPCKSRD